MSPYLVGPSSQGYHSTKIVLGYHTPGIFTLPQHQQIDQQSQSILQIQHPTPASLPTKSAPHILYSPKQHLFAMARYWECHKCSTETRAHVAGCRRCGHKRLTPCCGEFYDRFGKDKSSESRRRSGSALDDTPKKLDISHRDLRASKSG